MMERTQQEEGTEAIHAAPAPAEENAAETENTAAVVAATVQPASASEEEKAVISRQIASKWVKNSVLQQDPRVSQHIPETRFFSPANVSAMLSRYGKVVLKPVVGTGGVGVIMVIRTGAGYTIRHKRKVTRCRNFRSMMAAIGAIRRRRSYLVQRGISLASIRGRPIDYRVKVVKQNHVWVTRAMVGRLANPGFFVTNLCRGGTMLSSTEGIRRSLPKAAVRRKKQEMRNVTRISTQLLERHFPGVGQLGFDYGFDRSGKLWIFEVNTRPH
ncbi:YheC/YheD family protein [Paenibacillus sp. GCM10012303]|jgi:glutathione synthase/RimK-type ligase-like ATP-grasp enzyme